MEQQPIISKTIAVRLFFPQKPSLLPFLLSWLQCRFGGLPAITTRICVLCHCCLIVPLLSPPFSRLPSCTHQTITKRTLVMRLKTLGPPSSPPKASGLHIRCSRKAPTLVPCLPSQEQDEHAKERPDTEDHHAVAQISTCSGVAEHRTDNPCASHPAWS